MSSLPGKKKVAYGRVSSREQAEDHRAAEQQIDRLKREEVDEIFFDIESGDSKERPSFNRLMGLIRQGEISMIVATRWDRLTRNQEIYLELKRLLQECGVRLHLLDQGEADLNTASGELSADMQAIFAVHERRMLRERILKGFAYRRRRKAALARAPWGYVVQEERYVLDKRKIICLLQDRPPNYLDLYGEGNLTDLPGISRSDIAREAVVLVLEKHRPRQVLKILHEKYGVMRKAFVDVQQERTLLEENLDGKSKKRVKRSNCVLTQELVFWNSGANLADWLRNPVLRGHTAYCKYQKKGKAKPAHEWEMHHDTHPDQRLMTEEEFDQIQVILKSNSRKVGAPGSRLYLTGLVYCNECGHKMIRKASAEHNYYGCRHSGIGCNNQKCIRLEILDAAIIDRLFERAVQVKQDTNHQLQELPPPPELIALRQQLEVIDLALSKGSSDALKRAKRELVQEIEQFDAQMSAIKLDQASALEVISYPQLRDLAFWHTRTYKEREILYEKLIRRVAVQDGQVVAVDLTV